MRIVEPGHVYAMANVDGPGEQEIRFVRRRDEHARLLAEFDPGVLSQELLRVLIDRVRYLNDEDPCLEDVEIIGKLRECLRAFEARASRRMIEKMPMPEMATACLICHHLICEHGHRGKPRLDHEVRR